MIRADDFLFVSGLPPFAPDGDGNLQPLAIEQQSEIVLDQLKLCLGIAGLSLEKVVKCNVYCTDPNHFAAFNEIYSRRFPKSPPARIFVCVPCWPKEFDIEIDCIALA